MTPRRAAAKIPGRLPVLPVLLLTAVCACDAASPGSAADGVQRDQAPDTAAVATQAPGSASSEVDSEGTSAPGAALVIDGDGLRVFILPSGASRPIPFGTRQDSACQVIDAAIGAAPIDEGESPECRVDYAVWQGGLTTFFRENRFVGWSLRSSGDGSAGLTTASGVGIGSTRAELEDSYAIHVARSSLGIEFSAGGLAGILDSSAPDARVVNLWAGETCIAR